MEQEKIVSVKKLYLVFFALLPFVFSSSVLDGGLVPKQLYLLGFLVVLVVLGGASFFSSVKEHLPKVSKHPLFLLGALGILVCAVSFSSSIVLSESWLILSRKAALFTFFTSTTVALLGKLISVHDLKRSVFGFLFTTVILLLWNLLTGVEEIQELKATFGNKNLLASALFLACPFVLSYQPKRKIENYIRIATVMAVGVFLLFIQSRAVLLAGLVMTLVALPFYLKGKSKKKKWRSFFIVGGTVGIIGGVSFMFAGLLPKLYSLTTFQTRWLLWENSWQIFKQNSFLGVGAGNWKAYFPMFGLSEFNTAVQDGFLIYQRAHNDFLQVFCEEGVLSGLGFMGLFLAPIILLLRKKSLNEEKRKVFKGVAVGGLLGFSLIALVDYPMERIEHQILFFSLLSVVTFYTIDNVVFKKSVSWKVILTPLIIMVLFSSYFSINRFTEEKQVMKIHEYHQLKKWKKLTKVSKNTDPFFLQLDPMAIPILWYQGVGEFTMGQFKKSKLTFEKALTVAPYNIHVLNNLGSSCEKVNKRAAAMEYYKKSLQISPAFGDPILNLTAVYFNDKRIDDAFNLLGTWKGNKLHPRYKQFILTVTIKKLKNEMYQAIAPRIKVNPTEILQSEQAIIKYFNELTALNKDQSKE